MILKTDSLSTYNVKAMHLKTGYCCVTSSIILKPSKNGICKSTRSAIESYVKPSNFRISSFRLEASKTTSNSSKSFTSDFSYTSLGSKLELKAAQVGNSKYRWLFGKNDSIITTGINCSFTITKPEQYQVCLKVTNIANCESETCKNASVGISTLHKTGGIKLYPNPNTGSFTVEIENLAKVVSIEVYDLIGNLVKRIESSEGKSVIKVDLDVAEGVYLLKLRDGERVGVRKVVVER